MLNLLLGSLKFVTKNIPTIAIGIVAGLIIYKTYFKIVPHENYHVQTVTVNVTDSAAIAAKIIQAIKDTLKPEIKWYEAPFADTPKPDTAIRYTPVTQKDSAQLSKDYSITHLWFDNGDLITDAFNPAQRQFRHYTWSNLSNNFEVGGNSQEVWVLEHYQWIKWNGIKLGGSWNFPGGYLFAEPSVTFFKHLNLDAGLTSTLKPFEVRLSYEVLQ